MRRCLLEETELSLTGLDFANWIILYNTALHAREICIPSFSWISGWFSADDLFKWWSFISPASNSLLPPVKPQPEQFVLLPLASHSVLQADIPAVNMFNVVVMWAPEFLCVYLWQRSSAGVWHSQSVADVHLCTLYRCCWQLNNWCSLKIIKY